MVLQVARVHFAMEILVLRIMIATMDIVIRIMVLMYVHIQLAQIAFLAVTAHFAMANPVH
jgi:hypothetical protein